MKGAGKGEETRQVGERHHTKALLACFANQREAKQVCPEDGLTPRFKRALLERGPSDKWDGGGGVVRKTTKEGGKA